jgi:tartrate/fumarate subfamily iron-sulfur-dependent hydro-lyase beta chain
MRKIMAVFRFKTPISEEDVRKLKVNDVLYISGTMVTARDEAHKKALELYREGKKLPLDLEGLVVFHCGPIVEKKGGKWVVVAAGPTTSTRMDQFEDEFIKAFKVRVVIGKGGMGKKTTEAMQKYGAVYGAFTGGAAILAAKAVKNVRTVEWLQELGMPEALWVFEVEEFGPLTIAIDSHGNSLFEEIKKKAEENRTKIYQKLGT